MGDQIDELRRLMAEGRWDEAIALVDGHPALARFVDAQDFGRALLHDAACYDGAAPLVARLLAAGADPSLQSTSGSTPLGNAIHHGHRYGLDTDGNIRLLVAAGADLGLFDDTGNPPLHAAIDARRPEIVRLLLEAGADPFRKNAYGDDVFAWMAWLNDDSLRPLIERHLARGGAPGREGG